MWEMRGPPRHHVHGKIMSWVALDRAIQLMGADRCWVAERERIAREVQDRGVDSSGGHLLQAFDHAGTDAALLTTPMYAFPTEAGTLEATVAAIERELRYGDVVYRYQVDDGLEGGEGAFLICSFWLVDALLFLDRGAEARALFERLAALANDIGLYSEEIEPDGGLFLGNFPQAFSHLALIGSAIHLQLYEAGGIDALRGSHADRATRSVGATLGWQAIWAVFKASRRVGRIFSSRRSIMPDLGRLPPVA
jgi:GH15 family glucan-1,4-alpha-glucosidase